MQHTTTGLNLVEDPNLQGYKIISDEDTFVNLFNDLARKANSTALSKGFNNAETDPFVQICLIHSELGEATDALRKNKVDDHIPKFFGVEAELADAVIRIMNMAAAKNLRVAEAIVAKMEYNRTRPYKHGGKSV